MVIRQKVSDKSTWDLFNDESKMSAPRRENYIKKVGTWSQGKFP